jgi:hypothetical protein
MVGIFPFSLFGFNPVIVDSKEDFLAVNLQFLQSSRKSSVNTGLPERVIYLDDHGAIPGGGIAGFVIFCFNGNSLFPAGNYRLFPSSGQILSPDYKNRTSPGVG